jgi:glucose/arabinose dehydrogenase
MRKLSSVVLLLALSVLGACADEAIDVPTSVSDPRIPKASNGSERDAQLDLSVELELEPFVDGLQAPLLLTHAGDGSGRSFVVEQGGTIRTVEGGRVQPEPFLDISDRTEAGGEQGLLGLAFHPAYERNGRFFVNYTDLAGDTIVASYRADGTHADPDSEEILLKIDQPYPNHNGGHLAFGPDGFLYIATGDGGSAGDPEENGQNLDSLLGKLLRIDVDGGEPYGIPPDNPYADSGGGAPEVWSYGLRNPWRFSFDPEAGRLWVGDVGQGDLEEINRVREDEAGLNFGWNEMEGSLCYEAEGCDTSGKVLPITEYGHDLGCSVTGGFVYRGEDFPELQGAYLFGDYCSGHVWGIDAAAGGPVEPTLLMSTDRALSSFGLDEDGELYITDIGAGEVLKVVTR